MIDASGLSSWVAQTECFAKRRSQSTRRQWFLMVLKVLGCNGALDHLSGDIAKSDVAMAREAIKGRHESLQKKNHREK